MSGLDLASARRLLDDPGARVILPLLNADGGEARIVGGAVRNALIGREASDIDLTTTLHPDAVLARAAAAGIKAVPTGAEHGTVTLVVGKRGYEVTTLRRDVETDGRRAVVAFSDSFEEDAVRRDFTINQLALAQDGALHDHAGGLADLAARRVRFIGSPEERIREDYLRILRFFRFSAEYAEGEFDAAGLAACRELAAGMAILSRERIWTELRKLLVAPRALHALEAMIAAGVWARISGQPARLEALEAAMRHGAADAVGRFGALAVRLRADAEEAASSMRMSSAERRRLAGMAEALAAFGEGAATGRIPLAAYRLASIRHGPVAARDAVRALAHAAPETEVAALLADATPPSPFGGALALSLGLAPGPAVGRAVARAQEIWVEDGCPAGQAAAAATMRRAIAETDGAA